MAATITVKELHEALGRAIKEGHGDTPVAYGYDYGDYCHRTAVALVSSHMTTEVGHSDYMRRLEYRDDNDYDGETQTVFLLD